MKLIKKHYIKMQLEDKETLLKNALDIDQGISREEFVEYIDGLLNSVALMMENELTQK